MNLTSACLLKHWCCWFLLACPVVAFERSLDTSSFSLHLHTSVVAGIIPKVRDNDQSVLGAAWRDEEETEILELVEHVISRESCQRARQAQSPITLHPSRTKLSSSSDQLCSIRNTIWYDVVVATFDLHCHGSDLFPPSLVVKPNIFVVLLKQWSSGSRQN